MRWATRSHIHFDRVASAWLILRFIDKDAQFLFLAENEEADTDVTLFGIPGSRLASHDGKATTFGRILEAYSIMDTALAAFAVIVADTVDHVMHDKSRADVSRRDRHVSGILAVAEGIMLLSDTDDACLERSVTLYDALYARLQAQVAIDEMALKTAETVLEQTVQISLAARKLRETRRPFTSGAFASVLSARPTS